MYDLSAYKIYNMKHSLKYYMYVHLFYKKIKKTSLKLLLDYYYYY